MKYEYVIYAGEGTLIQHGVLEEEHWEEADIRDAATFAFCQGYSIQAEPCDDDTVTGQ